MLAAMCRGSVISLPVKTKSITKSPMQTAQEILAQLDQCNADFTFPMLDNGYVYPADVRMNIYRSDADWLIILEALGAYSPRLSRFDSFQNCLHLFGSRLHRDPGTANGDFLYPIDNCDDAPLFAEEFDWFAREDASCVMVRWNVRCHVA